MNVWRVCSTISDEVFPAREGTWRKTMEVSSAKRCWQTLHDKHVSGTMVLSHCTLQRSARHWLRIRTSIGQRRVELLLQSSPALIVFGEVGESGAWRRKTSFLGGEEGPGIGKPFLADHPGGGL